MSHNQDLAKIFNGLVLGGKIKLVQNSWPVISVFVKDLEHTHLTGARMTQDFGRGRMSGLFILIYVNKESQCNTNCCCGKHISSLQRGL